ncbi:ArsR family transcriptional regulator [Nonlabens sp. YIK11]|uniref:ArsR/SmtB family transcription factor n=1 Tax=Nonlabens sp. YIK11 TaxID=1453349 RepID=UPI0006DC4E8E|nr:metalloregulator ArsR/SmtB family transcription factor [Nonlabens sp. YIK11]KQC32351.1 ArsR family transcriptional regulator [Nonlabens sp. YIK11]
MGTTKTSVFSKELNEVAAFAKAISHPARVAIIQHLLSRQTCVCGDLVDEIDLAQATISQHLKALKEIGIIKGSVEGTSTCYCMNMERWNALKSQLESQLLSVEHCSIDCC